MIPPLTLLTHRNHVCMASFSLKLLSLTICPHPTDILLSILRLCYELGSDGVNPALEKQNQVDSEFEARSVYKESSRALFGKQKQKENPVSENQEKKKDFLILQYEEEDAPLEQFLLTVSVNLVRREIYLLAGTLLRPHGLLELERRLRMMTNE